MLKEKLLLIWAFARTVFSLNDAELSRLAHVLCIYCLGELEDE
jgi:hypothetical protein